jgi:hypothetical protein
MHLAAAVECKPGTPPERPCVVVAGGREPATWEAYPGHEFIHTIGRLPCCATGGCWRSRSVPLGDGDVKDEPSHLCLDVVNNLPRCMDLISPEDVVERIELYFQTSRLRPLTAEQARAVTPFLHCGGRQAFMNQIHPSLTGQGESLRDSRMLRNHAGERPSDYLVTNE